MYRVMTWVDGLPTKNGKLVVWTLDNTYKSELKIFNKLKSRPMNLDENGVPYPENHTVKGFGISYEVVGLERYIIKVELNPPTG